ncbi:MAG: hypothetical protein JWN90_494 [Parcubacteria group bacterium]|nr:hypothetical protein [Parcubacteria group bacterium]
MDNVTFEEESISRNPSRYASASSKNGGITGWFIAKGFAKNESQAILVQIVIILIVVGISLYVWLSTGRHTSGISSVELQRDTEWMKQGHVGAPPANFMPLTK